MRFKFCPECGRQLKEGFKFCPECGLDLGESGGQATTAAKRQNVPQSRPSVQQALNMFDAQKFEEAYPHLSYYAEQGDAACQTAVGYCYFSGVAVEQNEDMAVYWFKKSAGQGYVLGQFYLGNCYYHGYGVAEDLQQAAYWLEKSAKQGYAEAQYLYGYMFTEGKYCDVDLKKALYWFELAAGRGNVSAQYNAAAIYLRGGDNYSYEKGVFWLQQAAKNGDQKSAAILKQLQNMG